MKMPDAIEGTECPGWGTSRAHSTSPKHAPVGVMGSAEYQEQTHDSNYDPNCPRDREVQLGWF